MFRYPLRALVLTACLVSGNLAAQFPGEKLWEFETGGEIYSSPALGADGTIYFGSGDKKLYALAPNGRKKWEFLTAGAVDAAPAIGPDGTIYIGSTDNTLYAVSADGRQLWEFSTSGPISKPCAVGSGGTLYVTSADGNLYAVNPNGSKKWLFNTGKFIDDRFFTTSFPSATVALDGTAYVGTATGYLYALRADGTVKWRFSLGQGIVVRSSCVLDLDGTIYVIIGNNNPQYGYSNPLLVLKPDGTKKWDSNILIGTPVIGQGGTLYGIGPDRFSVAAVLPIGSLKGYSTLSIYPFGLTTGLTICSDGTLLVGSDNWKLYALNSNGAKLWEFETGGTIYAEPAVAADGTVYVGSTDKKFYALKGTGGLATSAWPAYRRDAMRTGAMNLTVLDHTNLGVNMFAGLVINGSVGNRYRIEFAERVPVTWEPLATVTLDRTPYRFFDVESTNATKRFYRAVELP